MTTITTWLVYRPTGATVQQRITAALTDYERRYHARPTALCIHPTLTGQARALTVCAGLDITGNGGTLSQEVWLPKPERLVQEALL